MGIMTVKQYNRLVEAKKAGDAELMEQIRDEQYGVDSTIVDVEIEQQSEDAITDADLSEDVMGDIAAGISRKEIADKYNISTQKITSIVKKAS